MFVRKGLSVKCPQGYQSYEKRLECEYPDCPKYRECVAELGVGPADVGERPWLDPSMPVAFNNVEELYSEVYQYVYEHVDFIDPEVYDVVTTWVLLSYRVEDFTIAPYIYFVGPPDSGKTRALEVLHQLSCKAVNCASISAAALFRAVEKWRPTLLLDETEIYGSEARLEIQSLLNSGYRKGEKAIRVVKASRGELKLDCFDVFGLKALAGTGGLLATLQSRCITVNMERKTRLLRLFLDEKWGKQLRGKLTYYMFHHDGGLDLSEERLEKLGGTRLAELFYPLLKVAPTKEVQERIYTYALKLAGKRKEEEAASDEASVVKAIAELWKNGENGEVIPIHEIVLKVVELEQAYSEREKRTWGCRVGWITKRLGFQKCRVNERRAIRVNRDHLRRLMARYVPEMEAYLSSAARESDPGKIVRNVRNVSSSAAAENGVNLPSFGEKTSNQACFTEGGKGTHDRSDNSDNFPKPSTHKSTALLQCPQCRFKAFTEKDLKAHEAYHRGLNRSEQTSKISILKARLLKLVNSKPPLPLNEAIRMLMGEGMSEEEATDFLIDYLGEEAMPLHGENGECYLVPSDRYEDYKSTINHYDK
jgi:hypothetical protein